MEDLRVDIEIDDLTDDDWTTGSYQYILNKYNAESIKDYPPIHAVDTLSIATQSDPKPLKDVSENLMDELGGKIFGSISPCTNFA